jgi:hypothetical protein
MKKITMCSYAMSVLCLCALPTLALAGSAQGFLRVETPNISASFDVDGASTGATNSGRISVAAGTHEVVLHFKNDRDRHFTVEIVAGETYKLVYRLSPQFE